MTWIVAIALALGVFPSFTALSGALASHWPGIYRFTGPLNPMKVLAPIVIFYVWRERRRIPRGLARLLLIALAIGTVSTVISAALCHFPPATLREWSVIVLGCLSALAWVLLPPLPQTGVVVFWAFIVYLACLLDWLAPSSINWLYAHVFDPDTRALDFAETGRVVLTGVFGRQSLAKILAWMPWLLMMVTFGEGRFRARLKPALYVLAILSTGMILATSQRGPFVGMLAGWVAFAAHQALRLFRPRLAVYSLAAMIAALLILPWVVPRPLLETRLRSLLGMHQADQYGRIAEENQEIRIRITQYSLKQIATHPFGNACISQEDFLKAGIHHFSHAHNIILQQFRERGWIWGAMHLLLWLWALIGAWAWGNESGSALFAGIVTTLTLGMFDHPWWVLNHAVMIGVLLISGLWIRRLRA